VIVNLQTAVSFLLVLGLTACSPIQELDEGPINLFNGTDLAGWQNFGGGKFFVEDGTIVGESAPGLPNSFLATEKMYPDFELEVEFKIHPLLNSGIQIRSNTYAEETTTIRWGGRFKTDGSRDVRERVWGKGRFWGYQVEIDPTDRNWTGTLYEEGARGFLHNPNEATAPEGTFKPYEWNHFRIVAKGDRMQTWLNGVAIADVQDDLTSTGYIALQLHGIGNNKEKIGKKVSWKNIKLTKL
tara:strand:- start:3132 stop:3854 length:723 start_codon:yes stop_codon:yes gene_type:complete